MATFLFPIWGPVGDVDRPGAPGEAAATGVITFASGAHAGRSTPDRALTRIFCINSLQYRKSSLPQRGAERLPRQRPPRGAC